LNDIACCTLSLDREIAIDSYESNRYTGSFIVIDRYSNETVGAGMILSFIDNNYTDDNLIYDIWNTQKQLISKQNKSILFKERDILFIQMGKNIGYEQDGKGKDFLRPVLVYKKFNNEQFLGFPFTSKVKNGKFYQEIEHNSRKSYAILSQIKVYSAKRIKYKLGSIGKNKLKEVHSKFMELVTPQ